MYIYIYMYIYQTERGGAQTNSQGVGSGGSATSERGWRFERPSARPAAERDSASAASAQVTSPVNQVKVDFGLT